jgi:hypothetical protein
MELLTIRADMDAGSNFTDAPPSAAAVDSAGVRRYVGLTAGGHLLSGGKYNIRRILLKLADAKDWTLSLRTQSAAGTPEDVVVMSRRAYERNEVVVSDTSIISVFPGDQDPVRSRVPVRQAAAGHGRGFGRSVVGVHSHPIRVVCSDGG